MTLLEAISLTARELFKIQPSWFAVKSPDRQFSLVTCIKRKPKLPPGFEFRGPVKTRDDAAVKALLWELETRVEE
jgi:hypothetical protein